jgi:hypothetical protein
MGHNYHAQLPTRATLVAANQGREGVGVGCTPGDVEANSQSGMGTNPMSTED